MNEGINKSPSPEEQKRQQEKEDAEQLASHFAIHPEQLIIPASVRESEPEIEELKVKYIRLSRAVGIIHNGKIDHNR